MSAKKLLFLTLNTFSSTGGIEKVCRVAGKALHQIAGEKKLDFCLFSLNDSPAQVDERYIPASSFFGFAGNKLKFIKNSIQTGRKSETVVLSHIHLLLVGAAIKLLSPKTKIILIAHGIEVWRPLPKWKVLLLKKLDLILPVSQFTSQTMKRLYGVEETKLLVVNNCLDPFLQRQSSPVSAVQLREKYGLQADDILLLTLSRIQFSEQYKGYDKVIESLPDVLKTHPGVKYFIAGKYDTEEKQRLDALVEKLALKEKIIFSGFLPDEEMEPLFDTASLYIMPSTGEGFGIVFVEAMFYNKPVIAGNVDGSVDALANGSLGVLVNPHKKEEIVAAINRVLTNPPDFIPSQPAVLAKFGFPVYQLQLRKALSI